MKGLSNTYWIENTIMRTGSRSEFSEETKKTAQHNNKTYSSQNSGSEGDDTHMESDKQRVSSHEDISEDNNFRSRESVDIPEIIPSSQLESNHRTKKDKRQKKDRNLMDSSSQSQESEGFLITSTESGIELDNKGIKFHKRKKLKNLEDCPEKDSQESSCVLETNSGCESELDDNHKKSKKKKNKKRHKNHSQEDILKRQDRTEMEPDDGLRKPKQKNKNKNGINEKIYVDDSFQSRESSRILETSTGSELELDERYKKPQEKRHHKYHKEFREDIYFQNQESPKTTVGVGLEPYNTNEKPKKRKKAKTHQDSKKLNQDDSFQSQKSPAVLETSVGSDLEFHNEHQQSKKQKKRKLHMDESFENHQSSDVLETSHDSLSDYHNRHTESKKQKRDKNVDMHVDDDVASEKSEEVDKNSVHNLSSIADELELDDIEKVLDEVELKMELSDDDIQRLSNLEIPLLFDVPASHRIETKLSHEPSREQLQAFAECGIEMKKGRFNPEEDHVIRNNWKKFCDEFGFDDPGPFILMSYNGRAFLKYSERLKFVQYIANELPNRFLCSVYRRFKTLFARRASSGRYSRYNVDVDELILKSMSKGWKDPFAKLATVTGRDRHSLCYRYRQLLTNKDYQGPKRVQWTHQLAEKIVQSLIEVCEIQDDDDALRTKCITWNIWLLCSLQCGIRPKPMKLFWLSKLYTQIFATRPLYRKAVVKDLIERLLASGAKYWQDIIWRKIATDFYGCTPLFLLKILMLYKEHVPKTKWRSARATAKFIQKNMDKIKVKDARLQRYRIEEDGKLVLVDDEVGNY